MIFKEVFKEFVVLLERYIRLGRVLRRQKIKIRFEECVGIESQGEERSDNDIGYGGINGYVGGVGYWVVVMKDYFGDGIRKNLKVKKSRYFRNYGSVFINSSL